MTLYLILSSPSIICTYTCIYILHQHTTWSASAIIQLLPWMHLVEQSIGSFHFHLMIIDVYRQFSRLISISSREKWLTRIDRDDPVNRSDSDSVIRQSAGNHMLPLSYPVTPVHVRFWGMLSLSSANVHRHQRRRVKLSSHDVQGNYVEHKNRGRGMEQK